MAGSFGSGVSFWIDDDVAAADLALPAAWRRLAEINLSKSSNYRATRLLRVGQLNLISWSQAVPGI